MNNNQNLLGTLQRFPLLSEEQFYSTADISWFSVHAAPPDRGPADAHFLRYFNGKERVSLARMNLIKDLPHDERVCMIGTVRVGQSPAQRATL